MNADQTTVVVIHHGFLLNLWLIPLLPFAGFLINGILGARLPKWIVTTVGLLAPLLSFAIVLSVARTFFGIAPSLPAQLYTETLGQPWISIGTLHIHIYSVGYMHGDKGYARYFSYLNLFLFFMTTLVLAGNLLLMFVGWEGVGLASYLLIGFWFQKTSAADAGKK